MTIQGGTIRIEVAFKSTANLQQVAGDNPPFTLDDAVLGELDVIELPGGPVWVDITDSFIDGLSIDRGRNRSVDLFTAGRASFRLDNRDRTFDPFNSDSPFFGNLTPMRPARITAVVGTSEVRLFSGFVTDWVLRYERGLDAWVEVECVDAFVGFAADVLAPVTPVGASEKAGARIGRVLNASNWGPQRNLSTGTFDLAETELGRNALVEMQESAAGDAGLLFMSRDGVVTFKVPTDVFAGPPDVTFVQANTTQPGVRYVKTEVTSAAELLFNVVNVTWDGGTVSRTDAGSVAEYLPRTLTIQTVLENESDAELTAEFALVKFAHPEVRFDDLLVRMHDRSLTASQRVQVASLDIGSKVLVYRRPPGSGTPDEYSFTQVVEGLRWVYARDSWTVTLALGDVLGAPFTLDDAELGALDTGGILTF